MNKRRFSKELQQEQISRKQLSECLVAFGWLPTSPVDLGEDFIVHVYFDGQATGITFHVQEKSVTNIADRRKGDAISYSFKVADLIHWEGFALPVVLVVWDVLLREGRWVLAKEAIATLDKKQVTWRSQSTVRVGIPWANTTDSSGLTSLKRVVGQQVYPLIANGKELKMQMKLFFPNNQEGQEALQAFERHIKEGEPVALRGRTIQSLEFSEWWDRWFGGYDPDKVEIHLSRQISPEVFHLSMAIIRNDGKSAYITGVELRVIQAGTELAILTNDHQATPLAITFSVRKIDTGLQTNVAFSMKNIGRSVSETYEVLKFMDAVASGGTLRIDFQGADLKPPLLTVEPQPESAPDPKFFDLVSKLSSIQDRTGMFLKIPETGIPTKDASAIDELANIFKYGKTTNQDGTVILEAKGDVLGIMHDVHREGKPLYFKMMVDESFVDLFGLQVNTGPMIREVSGYIGTSVAELENAIKELAPEDFLSVKVIKATVIETFTKFNPAFGESRAV